MRTETARNTSTLRGDPWYVCPCGNDAESSGFVPCDEQGISQGGEDGPSARWSGEHYRCMDCGRFFSCTTLRVLGRIWEAGQPLDTSTAALADQYEAWQRAHGLTPCPPVEHLARESLHKDQREWLLRFMERRAVVDNSEKLLCELLRVNLEQLSRYEVEYRGKCLPLLDAYVREWFRSTGMPLRELLREACEGQPAVIARSGGCTLLLRSPREARPRS